MGFRTRCLDCTPQGDLKSGDTPWLLKRLQQKVIEWSHTVVWAVLLNLKAKLINAGATVFVLQLKYLMVGGGFWTWTRSMGGDLTWYYFSWKKCVDCLCTSKPERGGTSCMLYLCQLRTEALHCAGTNTVDHPSTAFNSSQLVQSAELHTRRLAVFYLPRFTNPSADYVLILMSIVQIYSL